jgi:hypothetical protein
MAAVKGTASLVSKTAYQVVIEATAGSGTAPLTYQWYRSTTSGFTPGPSNILTGETALSLTDNTVAPNTQYYYILVVSDADPSTAEYDEVLALTDVEAIEPNSFAQQNFAGELALRIANGTISCVVDAGQSVPLRAGDAVKLVDSASGAILIEKIAADTDEVFGYVNKSFIFPSFPANSAVEISRDQNAMYLYSEGAIARGAKVCASVAQSASVKAATGASGASVVGYCLDKAEQNGQLVRVQLRTPAFELDA